MARRVAINLGQRTSQNSSGRGKGSGRGRGRGRGQDRGGLTSHVENNSRASSKINAQSTTKDLINEQSMEVDGLRKLQDAPTDFVKSVDNSLNVRTSSSESAVEELIREIGPQSPLSNSLKRKYEEIESPSLSLTESNNILDIMGFIEFNSTKNKHVKGTDCYGINFRSKTEYRQYINRNGGSNRALSPTRHSKRNVKKIKISLKK